MCKTCIRIRGNKERKKKICFVSNIKRIFSILTQALPKNHKMCLAVTIFSAFLAASFCLSSSSCPGILKVHIGLASCGFFSFFCFSVPWAETNTLREVHTCVLAHMHSGRKKTEWKPLCAFLLSSVHSRTILLMTSYSQQQSVTFLRFTNLHWFPFPAWFCVSVPTSWMSVSPLSIQISHWYSISCVLLDISNIW